MNVALPRTAQGNFNPFSAINGYILPLDMHLNYYRRIYPLQRLTGNGRRSAIAQDGTKRRGSDLHCLDSKGDLLKSVDNWRGPCENEARKYSLRGFLPSHARRCDNAIPVNSLPSHCFYFALVVMVSLLQLSVESSRAIAGLLVSQDRQSRIYCCRSESDNILQPAAENRPDSSDNMSDICMP